MRPCQLLPRNYCNAEVSNETDNRMPAHSVSIEMQSGIARFPCDSSASSYVGLLLYWTKRFLYIIARGFCGYSGRLSDNKGSNSTVREGKPERHVERLGSSRVHWSCQLVRHRILQVCYCSTGCSLFVGGVGFGEGVSPSQTEVGSGDPLHKNFSLFCVSKCVFWCILMPFWVRFGPPYSENVLHESERELTRSDATINIIQVAIVGASLTARCGET